MHYTICIVRPTGYPHSSAFTELAEVIGYALEDLGNVVQFTENDVVPGSRNIVIGCHLADPKTSGDLPADTIIVNTEQLHVDELSWNENVYFWASHYETWDYNERNIAKLRSRGIMHAKYLKLGFHPKLGRIASDAEQDIDVLFYGSTGPRRLAILEALHARRLTVSAVFNVYGEARDSLIARSKVVLNLHHSASQIFEIVRVFFLMSNAKAVVGEVSSQTAIDPVYTDGFRAVPYDGLVDACVELVRDEERRKQLETAALATISRYPQAELLAPLLAPER
ncbi:hypothetical protein [Burkholderia sp. LMG 32019]|uniref:hypothetical protein n=1 Tax=Burkholderia sp. LMG 32019 TaxID=3158173 RepID=UPI003C2DD795